MDSDTANPHDEHVKGVRTFAEYIATSHDVGLTLGGEPEVDLFGFSDAAYLTKGDSLSSLAYCFFLNLTSDRLKIRQSRTRRRKLSSNHLMKPSDRLSASELTYPQSKPIAIYVDSKSSIAISESLKTGSDVSGT
jgi:hypothetical protein